MIYNVHKIERGSLLNFNKPLLFLFGFDEVQIRYKKNREGIYRG